MKKKLKTGLRISAVIPIPENVIEEPVLQFEDENEGNILDLIRHLTFPCT